MNRKDIELLASISTLESNLSIEKVELIKIKSEYFDMVKSRNQAYSERNQLLAFLSKIYPSSLERHNENDKNWDDDWRWIVFIAFGSKAFSWHVHDSELSLFDHITDERRDKKIFTWDGHSTEEKYDFLGKF